MRLEGYIVDWELGRFLVHMVIVLIIYVCIIGCVESSVAESCLRIFYFPFSLSYEIQLLPLDFIIPLSFAL